MKPLHCAALTSLVFALTGTAVLAQDHPMTHPSMSGPTMHGPSMSGPKMSGPQMSGPPIGTPLSVVPGHPDWRKGGHIQPVDWNKGHVVEDWREHHLPQAAAGREWRHVETFFVLADPKTGLIDAVMDAHH